MDSLPITIQKTWFGYLEILAAGLGMATALAAVILITLTHHWLDEQMFFILGTFIILILIVTGVNLYVYGLTTVVLTNEGIIVTNWTSLLTDQDGDLAWPKIQDVTSRQDGFWGQVVGYGTLQIQTAGTDKNFEITMIPEVDHWVDVINQHAENAPQLVDEK
jgi:hypothetical protein